MFSNYIKIAFRNILKHKTFSFINIIGLAIGLACSILIMLFVSYELSYDKYHEKADRTYRVAVRAAIGDSKIHQTYSSAITFLKFLEDFPEVETGVKIIKMDEIPVIKGEKTIYETELFAADSSFFDVFTVPLLSGIKTRVLVEPNSMVITESTAIKYFGTTDVLGEVLKVKFQYGLGTLDFVITGVSEDMPGASHFHYNFLISLTTFPQLLNNTGWTANNFISYFVLKDKTSLKGFEEKLPDFTRKYMSRGSYEEYDAWIAEGNYWEYFLQAVTDIHLDSDLNGEFEPNGNRTYVSIFSIISIIILLIACINFMNLTTAKSSLRAKEVGIRKTTGSGRIKLIRQFLGESLMLSFLALILGISLVELLLPVYSNLIGRPLEIHYFNNFKVIPSFIILGILVGIVSGSYPAFFLSSFKPVLVLKGSVGNSKGGVWIRNLLVLIQFSISIFLIIGTITIYRQLSYLQNKKLGFTKEHVLIIKNPGSLGPKTEAFKSLLSAHSSVVNVSGSNTLPGQGFSNIGFGAEEVEQSFTLNLCICDYNFLNTLDIRLLEGRFFSQDFPSDSSAIVLNKKALELLDWDEPIGKHVNNWSDNRGTFTVIGIIDDYHYESLHSEVRPMALLLNGGYYKRGEKNISVKFSSGDVQETIEHAKNTWNKFAPGKPFDYSFFDQDYEELYMNEAQTKKLFSIFSFLAIFIACMGLYGLASFVTDQRTKEIGIRKTLGASVSSITLTLNRSFTYWVLLANIIAWPVAWYFMKKWLQNFAYHVEISWWSYLASAILALLIALTVVSIQTIRAAKKNPVESLKYE